jgi:cellulose synthase/poly-beta-1,6-N-acetylglucosamine synthase-like glycosyltransferase
MNHRKAIWPILIPPLLVAAAVALVLFPWMKAGGDLHGALVFIVTAAAMAWIFLLWVGLHRLTWQIAALWKCTTDQPESGNEAVPDAALPRFAIFYTTCDDLVESCLRSCVEQDYPAERMDVFVCDDSADPGARLAVDQMVAECPTARLIRRDQRAGFKAGNLNHAFEKSAGDAYDWIVLVDADQMLPPSYLRALAKDARGASQDVAFLQSGQVPEAEFPSRKENLFQSVMRPEVHMLFERDLPWRYAAGFYPFLGHAGAVRSSIWQRVGGFPLSVSEDMAFAMALHGHGLRGVPAATSRSSDGIPENFSAFVVRLSKYAAGAAELLTRYFPAYLKSPAHVVEKVDLGAWLCGYALFPVLLVTLPVATWLNHQVWSEGLAILPPVLAAGFVGMFLVSFAPLISVTASWGGAIKHWFWSFAAYAAAMPVAAFSFVIHLFGRPRFRCTPKGGRASPRHILAGALTCLTGLSLVLLALLWASPFGWVTASFGSAQMMFPLLLHLHRERGFAVRLLVWLPGLLFAWGIASVWLRGS